MLDTQMMSFSHARSRLLFLVDDLMLGVVLGDLLFEANRQSRKAHEKLLVVALKADEAPRLYVVVHLQSSPAIQPAGLEACSGELRCANLRVQNL